MAKGHSPIETSIALVITAIAALILYRKFTPLGLGAASSAPLVIQSGPGTIVANVPSLVPAPLPNTLGPDTAMAAALGSILSAPGSVPSPYGTLGDGISLADPAQEYGGYSF